MNTSNASRREPPALFVNYDAGVVVRPPTFAEVCALDLSAVPLETLHHMGKAISAEINSRKPAKGVGLLGSGTAARRAASAARFRPMPRWSDDEASALRAHFEAVLDDDWSELFAGGSTDRAFYVYVHYDPEDGPPVRLAHRGCCIDLSGRPFYVGKGSGDRAYVLRRNDGHGAILRSLRRRGLDPADVVQIVADGLTEAAALELESKLVYFFGSRYDRSEPGCLVNLDILPSPIIKPILRRPRTDC